MNAQRPYESAHLSASAAPSLTSRHDANHARGAAPRRARGRRLLLPVAIVFAAACSGTPGGEVTPDSTAREVSADTVLEGSDTLIEAADTFFENSGEVWREARARGVTFRAVGQEPGWLVEIGQNDTLRIVVDYGAREIEMAVSEPAVDSTGLTTYLTRSAEHTVRIDIRAEPCADTMSGERFGASVLMVLDGVRYSGCGRTLTPP